MPKIPRKHKLVTADCLEYLSSVPTNYFSLVFTSPPYENARTYGIGFSLKGNEWVDWAIPRFEECLRVCSGLVAWVVQGKTKNYRWSAVPAKLLVKLEAKGYCPRRPIIFSCNGIPGSGGPDWLRASYHEILCFTREQGRLLWSDNTAMGEVPKYPKGGEPTHYAKDGSRIRTGKGKMLKSGPASGRGKQWDGKAVQPYIPPKRANPGDIIHCPGGHLGSEIAHENEAAFPERLAEFFVRSFCPPRGRVCDPFGGSGTTLAVCEKTGRYCTSIDVRESQTRLMERRLGEARGSLPTHHGG